MPAMADSFLPRSTALDNTHSSVPGELTTVSAPHTLPDSIDKHDAASLLNNSILLLFTVLLSSTATTCAPCYCTTAQPPRVDLDHIDDVAARQADAVQQPSSGYRLFVNTVALSWSLHSLVDGNSLVASTPCLPYARGFKRRCLAPMRVRREPHAPLITLTLTLTLTRVCALCTGPQ